MTEPPVAPAPASPLAGRWYFVVSIVSFGVLAWVPFVHAAARLRRRFVRRLAVIYAGAAAVISVLLMAAPTDASGEVTAGAGEALTGLGGLLAISVMAVACVQQSPLRREVYGAAAPQVARIDPALTAALAARGRRDTARKLAAADPMIARDLRIGRPDLTRDYDDGGLVDLNSAPASAIADVCEVSGEVADGIVATRTACGGFHTVDDVLTLADVPVDAWNMVRERGVVVPG